MRASVATLAAEHQASSLHQFNVPEHRGTQCRQCDALADLDAAPPPLTVTALTLAIRELAGRGEDDDSRIYVGDLIGDGNPGLRRPHELADDLWHRVAMRVM